MKKLLLIILITQISMFNAFTENEKIEYISHYIGAAAGFSTGYGLSYRYWPGNYGTQIVFAPYSDGVDTTINIGSAALKTLFETKYTRLFLYLAGNTTYQNYEEWYNEDITDPDNDTYDTRRKQAWSGTVGIGPGLEIYLFTNIVLDIMFGYKYSVGEFMSQEGIGFTAEAALYYRF